MPPFPALRDEMRAAENSEMLGDRRPRYRESPRDVTGGPSACTQQIEYGASGGIR
jgi:hypothetical protein